VSEQPNETKPEFPKPFLRLYVTSFYAFLVWWVAGAVASVAYINRGRPRVVYLGALIAAGVAMAAFLVTATIVTIWLHRLTGEWPWTGWTPRSVLRSWLGSVGLTGPERFGSKPRHKVELAILVFLAALIGLMAFAASRS
jgi:hypothetical protein